MLLQRFFLIGVFVFVSCFLNAQTFKVAVAIDSNDEALANHFSLLLQQQMVGINDHLLSTDEKEGYLDWQRSLSKANLLQKLLENKTQQDRFHLNEHHRATTLSTLKKEEKRLRKELETLKIADPSAIWPIEWGGSVLGVFNDSVQAKESDVIFWLHGQLNEVRPNIIYINFSYYNSLTGQLEQLYRATERLENLETVSQQIIENAAQALLGRPWASINVQGNLRNTTMMLNGERVLNIDELKYLPTGFYLLAIKNVARLPFEESFQLEHQQIINVDYNPLFSNNEKPYTLISEPTGAMVYLDGSYIGLTPVLVQAGKGQFVTLYNNKDKTLHYQLGNSYSLFFNFEKDNKEEEKKKIFYTTYTIFIVSLAVPVVFFSLYQNAQSRAIVYGNAGQLDQDAYWQNRANTYAIVAGAGAGASALMLGISISSLYRYIKATNYDPTAY